MVRRIASRKTLLLVAASAAVALTGCGSKFQSGVPSQSAWSSAPVASGSASLPAPTSAGISISPLVQFCTDVSVNQGFLAKIPTTSQQAAQVAAVWDTIAREAPDAVKPTIARLALAVHSISDGKLQGLDSSALATDLGSVADWVTSNCKSTAAAPSSGAPSS